MNKLLVFPIILLGNIISTFDNNKDTVCEYFVAMSDKDTESLLRLWALPESVIEKFKENEIHSDQLKNLNDDILKELCPLIGPRLLLKSKIDEYLTANTDTETANSLSLLSEDDLGRDFDDTLIENLFPNVRPPLSDFDLKTLLSTTPCGKSIITYYDTHNTLTNKHRNQLVDIIVRHIFTRIINYKITYEEYNLIAGKIIVLFPRESSGTYFVPPVKKNDSLSGKPLYAKGKLVDKVRNTLYKSGEKRKSKLGSEQEEKAKKNKYIEELRDENEDKLTFLKNNSEPWDKIIEYWHSTYHLREHSTKESVAEFLEDWNILNDPRGEILINLDFDKKYKENSLNFYTKWHTFINTIVRIKYDMSKDETVANLYENIIQQSDDDRKIPDQIKLLCYLIPPRGRLNKKTKFSTLECIENFIVDVDNFGDIEKKIEDLKIKSRRQKQTLQPYLISYRSIGNDNESKIYYYLVIDKVKYRFDTAPKAFDTLFKSYHVLHASYPAAAAHLYLLVQRCVYGFETKYDKIVPYISDLLTLAKL